MNQAKKRLLPCYLILFTFIIIYNKSSAQYAPIMQEAVNEMNFTYSKPPGFVELDSSNEIFRGNACATDKMIGRFSYSIESKRDGILIEFILFNIPNITPWQGYQGEIHYLADTINSQVIFYEDKYIKKTSNADVAGQFKLIDCPLLKVREYVNCEVVFLYKKGRGQVNLFYFYSNKDKDKIERYIRRTAKIIRFNE